MMEDQSIDVVAKKCRTETSKKPRRRMRAIFTKIKEQFYFSDANLHKDRYLKQVIEATSDGYISLDVFVKFNKILSITNEVSVIASAVEKSDRLQLNSEKTHVRRIAPLTEPENVDERTVYVESIPIHADHDWMKKLFSSCGKVVYVSLPKFSSTGDLKGFAFIEFETIQGAQEACKKLNNPSALQTQKVGMFPKTSHQLDSLKKKLPEEQIQATVEMAKELVSSNIDLNVNVENEQKEPDIEQCIKNESGNVSHNKVKRTQHNSETDGTEASPIKRRKVEVSFNLPPEELESDEDVKTANMKKKSRKRKGRSKRDSSTEEGKAEQDLNKAEDYMPAKKQRLDSSGVSDNDTEGKCENGFKQEPEKTVRSSNKENSAKKKKRFRRKKQSKEKEIPPLRVITKKEWLELRDEYLKLQKTSMSLLKKTVGELKQGNIGAEIEISRNTEMEFESSKNLSDKPEHKEIHFVADVIIKVSSEKPMTRKFLKEMLGIYQIAYFDVIDQHLDGYIRCLDAESAKQITALYTDGFSFTLISGDNEKMYWDKLAADRDSKHNTKSRNKRRGHQKWMDKAQKASVGNMVVKHMVFDDD